MQWVVVILLLLRPLSRGCRLLVIDLDSTSFEINRGDVAKA